MTTLSTRARPERKTWTVADLYRRFGPIPFERGIRRRTRPSELQGQSTMSSGLTITKIGSA